MRGICVFVRKSLRISGVVKIRDEIGERISFLINDKVSFTVLYRDPNKLTTHDYDLSMNLFTDIFTSTIPTIFLGDFNWEILKAPDNARNGAVHSAIPIADCTSYPHAASTSTRR